MTDVYPDEHWDDPDRLANYVQADWFYVDTEPAIPREALEEGELGRVNWNTQSSGISVEDSVADLIWEMLERSGVMAGVVTDAEFSSTNQEPLFEGGKLLVEVNKYERNPEARHQCLQHWSTDCQVCGVDLKTVYGAVGPRLVQVHHKTPLSVVGEEYEVDPIEDLVPVCPNCHMLIHSNRAALSVEEAGTIVAEQRERAT